MCNLTMQGAPPILRAPGKRESKPRRVQCPYRLIRHKVQDYTEGKPLFYQHEEARKRWAPREGAVPFTGSLNELGILLEVSDLAEQERGLRPQICAS